MAKFLLSLISIFLPIILGGNSSAGVTVRPGDGAYPVGTPVTIVLSDVHMCACIQVDIEGLGPDEYTATGNCDTGVGVATVTFTQPVKVSKIKLTPYWFNGDPMRYYTALVDMRFEAEK